MKVIILAAGMGTRLGNLVPKPLTAISEEKSILDFQVERISKVIDINDILLIVGYEFQKIMESHPDLTYVLNHDYATTGTAKSLLKALIKVKDEDVLWMNGDVHFDEGALEPILQCKTSCCLVNDNVCIDEEVRYNIDEDGFIKELSKKVKDSRGEALGINLVKAKDLELFKKALEEVGDNDYFEKAIENMIEKKLSNFMPILLVDSFCKEIDFPEDLAEVREYLATKD